MQMPLPASAGGTAREARILVAPVEQPGIIDVQKAAAGEMPEPEAWQVRDILEHSTFPAAGSGDAA